MGVIDGDARRSDTSQPMLRSLKLRNIGPSREMSFEPGKRLNVITGDNGLGKSFLLDLAWWAVTRTWAGAPIRPPAGSSVEARVDIAFAAKTKMALLSVPFDRAEQTWRFPKGQPGQPGLVVYARIDGGFAVWDSSRRFGDREESETGVPKSLVFARDEVWNGMKLGDKPICNGLLADWVSWQQLQNWEADALADALRQLSPSPDEQIVPGAPARIDLLDSRLIPTIRMSYGQEVPVTIASAGMKRILALAYLLVWAWSEHLAVSAYAGRERAKRMLVIIDEVEAHLHPKWQRVILPSIVEALIKLTWNKRAGADAYAPQIQYIVATHSPLVLASLEPIFDDKRDQLFELELQPDKEGKPAVALNAPSFRPQGDASRWLESEAFGLSSSRSRRAEQVLDEAAKLLDVKLPTPKQVAAMEAQLTQVLPEFDPFWIRWRAITEAHLARP